MSDYQHCWSLLHFYLCWASGKCRFLTFFSLRLISYPSCNLFHSNLQFHLRRCSLDEPVRVWKFGLLKFSFHLWHCLSTDFSKMLPFLSQIAYNAHLQDGCRWSETLLAPQHSPKSILQGFLFPNWERQRWQSWPCYSVMTVKMIFWWNNGTADTESLWIWWVYTT